MGHALGGLRRADDSCSPARTAVIEQLDIVEDSRLSSAFSHRTHRAGGLGCRSPARNRCSLIHQYRLPDLVPPAGAAVATADDLRSFGAAGTRPAHDTPLFGSCSAGWPRWPPVQTEVGSPPLVPPSPALA